MNHVFVKLRQRGGDKYRIILSTEARMYPELDVVAIREASYPYSPGTLLESDAWFYLEAANRQVYAEELLQRALADTVDFESLSGHDFENIDFLWTRENDILCFQRVSRAKLVSKRSILCLGDSCRFDGDRREIAINKLPDAVYSPTDNRIYFRRLDAITAIFNGIDQVYRTATDAEVSLFLHSNFISLKMAMTCLMSELPIGKDWHWCNGGWMAFPIETGTSYSCMLANIVPSCAQLAGNFKLDPKTI